MRYGSTGLYRSRRFRDFYLGHVAQPGNFDADDFGVLFSAADLPELVAVSGLLVPGLSTWLLLDPSGRRQAIMLVGRQKNTLDMIAAGPVAHIRFPEIERPATKDDPWARTLLDLLHYQFDVEDTTMLVPIWATGSLLAIAGISGNELTARYLAQGMTLAVRRVHDMDRLRRDAQGHKFLLAHATKSIVLATTHGKILNGTEDGLAVLQGLHADKPRSEQNRDVLPVALRRGLEAGERHLVMGDLHAHVSHPALLPPITTAEPLAAIGFSRAFHQQNRGKGTVRLTPAEQQVYVHLLAGDRNKEIASKVSSSEHTVRHHVSSILRKTGCSDRLLLIARSATTRPVATATLPVQTGRMEVPALQPVEDLPPAKYLNVGKHDPV
jgi:DNA-binding CsgD family transcriptional regulator